MDKLRAINVLGRADLDSTVVDNARSFHWADTPVCPYGNIYISACYFDFSR